MSSPKMVQKKNKMLFQWAVGGVIVCSENSAGQGLAV